MTRLEPKLEKLTENNKKLHEENEQLRKENGALLPRGIGIPKSSGIATPYT